MIDLHCHLLPAIDDGPPSLAESLSMARAAVAAGIETVVCTPHMIARYPTPPELVHERVGELERELAAAAIPLRVLPGAEIAIDHLPRLDDAGLRRASLGGGGRWLLLETPFRGWPTRLPQTVSDLEIRGFGVVLAHPERAEAVQHRPERLRELVGRGALVQLTAGSFLAGGDPALPRTAATLLRAGLAHFLASDAHAAEDWRPPGLTPGLEAAAEAVGAHPQTLHWMVQEGPAALLAGGPVRPPRLSPGRAPRESARPGGGARRPPTRG